MKALLVLIVLCLGAAPVFATDHYIRPAGSGGTGAGTSWTNAYLDFPSATTYQRGDEYFVAGGTYSGTKTFSTTTSGTTRIKICKATVSTVGKCSSAHGAAGDWNDAYASQALFNGVTGGADPSSNNGNNLHTTTGYWDIDGVVSTWTLASPGNNTASYGFYVHNTSQTAGSTIRDVRIGGTQSTVSHMAVTCNGFNDGDTSDLAFFPDGVFSTATFGTYSYVYAANCQGGFWGQDDDITLEYFYFGYNWYGDPNAHGNQIYGMNRLTVRWGIVLMCNSQCIEPGGGSSTNLDGAKIYGNIFLNQSTTNAVALATSSSHISTSLFYNNTIVNSGGPLLTQSQSGGNPGSGNVVENNLFYLSGICCDGVGTAATKNSNTYVNSGTQSETNVQNISGNPFVNYISCSDPFTNCQAGDLSLVSGTTVNAGLTLASPYDTDMFGTVRGADGKWDRGAIEFCVSGCVGAGSIPNLGLRGSVGLTGGVRMP